MSGTYVVVDRRIAQRHRINIGTIVSWRPRSPCSFRRRGSDMSKKTSSHGWNLRRRLLIFAGRVVEFIRVREMTARAPRDEKRNLVPRWARQQMPLSTQLPGDARAHRRGEARGLPHAEMRLCEPIFAPVAAAVGAAGPEGVAGESPESAEGWHWFFYPFEGRWCTWAWQRCSATASQKHPGNWAGTFSIAINDYGFNRSPTEVSISARAT